MALLGPGFLPTHAVISRPIQYVPILPLPKFHSAETPAILDVLKLELLVPVRMRIVLNN
jgi:hypothetical protein